MVTLLAESDSTLFLGEDFFPWMILAFGGAMVVGNVLALLRPPDATGEDASEQKGPGAPDRTPGSGETAGRPPLVRSTVMIVVGLAAALWSIATLLA